MLLPLTNNRGKIENEESNLVDILNNYDWSTTSLGPMDSWEPAFKASVNICLQTALPIVLYVGPDWTLIYNEAWRSMLMTNNQHALGKPAAQVWPEMYDNVLKPKLENIRATGKGIVENAKYFKFQRNGNVEEAYFDYSLSPLFKSDGTVWGVLNAMRDVTQNALNIQRLRTLEELRSRTSDAVSLASSCEIMKTVLHNNADIPYALIYLVENNDSKKSLSGFKSHIAHLAITTFDDGYINGNVVYGKVKRHFPDYFPETPEIIDLSKDIDENYNYIKQGPPV
ncbi:621_t:CDS:2 [Dentiscutata heterogama]|uniref:621_t:CDS:1 n=1 Tax=Dentiscutata heterogama TaxID=1316150 RepID=A0ACA9K8P1_9GLOM|nr:621_t:CDS:2 [Dentiscutata heterogama]